MYPLLRRVATNRQRREVHGQCKGDGPQADVVVSFRYGLSVSKRRKYQPRQLKLFLDFR